MVFIGGPVTAAMLQTKWIQFGDLEISQLNQCPTVKTQGRGSVRGPYFSKEGIFQSNGQQQKHNKFDIIKCCNSNCNKPFMLEKNYKSHYEKCCNEKKPIPKDTKSLKIRRIRKTSDGVHEWHETDKKLVYNATKKELQKQKALKQKQQRQKMNKRLSYWASLNCYPHPQKQAKSF